MKNQRKPLDKISINYFILLLFAATALLVNGCEEPGTSSAAPLQTTVPIVVMHEAMSAPASNGKTRGQAATGIVTRDAAGTLTYFRNPAPCGYINSLVNDGTVGTSFFFDNYFSSDFDGDGYTDLVCRNASGSLFFYPWNQYNHSFTGVGGGSNVGNGFNFDNYFIADFTGDGKSDLVGRNSTGTLYLYPFNNNTFIGQGGGQVIGSNFTGYTHYFVADWNNDTKADLICRNASGTLLYFPSVSGTFSGSGTVVGNGFNFSRFFITQINGNDVPDLICETSTGALKGYPFNNTFIAQGGGFTMYDFIDYNHYFFKDFTCDNKSDFIGVQFNGSVDAWKWIGGPVYTSQWFNQGNWNYENYFPGYY